MASKYITGSKTEFAQIRLEEDPRSSAQIRGEFFLTRLAFGVFQ
jgi:hypothetical protein